MTTHVETLPGGLRVVVETIPYVRSVSLGVWVGVGSRHEPPELAGISHLVEHLLFKGTERRSARQVAEEMDAIGGLLNGYTSKEYSCYYVKVLDEHLEKAMDLLSDLVLAPRFDPADLVKERRVVVEEIKMYEDTPDDLAGDLLMEAAWGDDPLGRPVLGRETTMAALGPEAVAGHHRASYHQRATVVAMAGNIDADAGVRLVHRYFAGMSRDGVTGTGSGPSFRPGYRQRIKAVEQAHVCLGYEAVSLADAALFDFHLLASILGGGSSSRLFQGIREERGLAYSVFSYASPYSDTGLLGVYAGVSPGNVRSVLVAAAAEIDDIRAGGTTPEELQRAKDQVKSSILLSLENTANRMSRLGRCLLLLGRVVSPEELARRIDEVSLESLTTMARRVLDPNRVALAVVGPEGLPGEDDLRAALGGREGR